MRQAEEQKIMKHTLKKRRKETKEQRSKERKGGGMHTYKADDEIAHGGGRAANGGDA